MNCEAPPAPQPNFWPPEDRSSLFQMSEALYGDIVYMHDRADLVDSAVALLNSEWPKKGSVWYVIAIIHFCHSIFFCTIELTHHAKFPRASLIYICSFLQADQCV